MAVTGIVLAAGAGTRAGGPKALQPGWLDHACAVLLEGGCDRVVVVLGAAPEAPIPVDARVTSTVATDWQQGISHSLLAGFRAASDVGATAALITLVDLPSMPAAVVARVLEGAGALRRAVFAGRPGHPVYISASHWALIEATGDHGAMLYLVENEVTHVECGDLWDGRDVDAPLA